MDEIHLMYRAQVYGEIEPLLECLEKYGLQQPAARKLVADLARKAPFHGERSEQIEKRNYRIAAMVANRRGLLKREGKDPRGAVSAVARELHLQGEVIDRKTVDRAWKEQLEALHPAVFEGFYRHGLEGFRIVI